MPTNGLYFNISDVRMSDAVEVACAVGVKVRWWSASVELLSVATLADVEANSKPVTVVIGGGLAGLSVALKLLDQGIYSCT